MSGDRSEAAIQRIEAALARIARVADNTSLSTPPQPTLEGSSANVQALVQKHETLRETVARTIEELDAVILGLEK